MALVLEADFSGGLPAGWSLVGDAVVTGQGVMYLPGGIREAFALSGATPNFGTGDFCMEVMCWLVAKDNAVAAFISTAGTAWGVSQTVFRMDSGGVAFVQYPRGIAFGGAVPSGQWVHIAVTRSGGVLRGFIGGALVWTDPSGYSSAGIGFGSPAGVLVGGNRIDDQPINGFVRWARLHDSAVYTSSFTPPGAPGFTPVVPGSATYAAAPDRATAAPGQSVTISAATSGVANGTTLYWTESGTATGDDIDPLSGSFIVNSNAGSFDIDVKPGATPGRTIIVEIRTGSTSGPVVDTADTVTIAPALVLGAAYEGCAGGVLTPVGVMLLSSAMEGYAAQSTEPVVGIPLPTAVESYLAQITPAVAVHVSSTELYRAPRLRTVRDYNAWLRAPDISRVLLVELDHSSGTKYVANTHYTSFPDDGYPNRPYDDIVASDVSMRMRFDETLTFSELELVNDGTLDDWTSLYWVGFAARYYLGERDWPLEDFVLVAQATNAGMTDMDEIKTRFAMVDSRAKLDRVVKTSVANPLSLGIVFNAAAALVDAATDKYRCTETPGRTILVTARDNGVEVDTTTAPTDVIASDGTITLATSPVGIVSFATLDPLYSPAHLAQWAADACGVPVSAASLAALPEWEMGIFSPPGDALTGKQLLDTICEAIYGGWSINELGELEIVQLAEPAETADFELTEDDIVGGGLVLDGTEEPAAKIFVYYERNYRPLEYASDATSAFADVRNALEREWYSSVVDLSVPDPGKHPAAQDVTVYTALASASSAIALRNHIRLVRGQRRERWSVKCLLAPALARIGDTVRITHPRFGWHNGRNARVVGIEPVLNGSEVTLEVWL